MKIACIGDSLGMPRENVLYEDTWFFRVQQSHPEKMFISCFQRSLTTDMLLDNFDEYSFIKPDYLILQLGICDCAPRLINDKSFFWSYVIKFARVFRCLPLFWKFIKRFFKRKPSRVYVPIKRFKSNLSLFMEKTISRMNVKKIIIIKICTPGTAATSSSPYMVSNIIKYNAIFDELAAVYPKLIEIINPLSDGDDRYYVDGYHPNKEGFTRVANDLQEIITTFES